MDFQFLPLNFITTTLLLSSLIFFLIKSRKKKPESDKKHENLPPSPRKLPIIGHLHHLIGGDMPHHALRRLAQKHGPNVLYLQLGEVLAIVISSREASKQVLKVHDPACADRPQTIGSKIMWYDNKGIAFSPYNDYWKQIRKICLVELFSAKNVKSFASIRHDEMSRFIERLRLSSGRPVNLTEMVFAFTSSVICRSAFGNVVRDDQEKLIDMMKEAVALAGVFGLADLFPSWKILNGLNWNKYKLMRMRRRMDDILDLVVEEHKLKQNNSGDEDIVDVFLRIQKDGKLQFPITNDTIKAVIFDLFSAGTETSSTTLDWTMAELMKNPRVMAKAQAEVREAFKKKDRFEENDLHELEYIKLVIKETLRLHPPTPLLPRVCRDECKDVDGYTIPLKSKVLINVWAMGRDPKYWDEPESFWPERFENSSMDFLGNNFEYIPFGAGKRICPGMKLGLANMELPLARLLYCFDWKMPHGLTSEDIDTSEVDGIAVTRKNGLFLVPIPKKYTLIP